MRRKKRSLHCAVEGCGEEIQTYRKGKKHRVLLCPTHGVIATNPIPLLAAGAALAKGLLTRSALKKVGLAAATTAAGTLLGKKLAKGAAGDDDTPQTTPYQIPAVPLDESRFTTEERVKLALR